MLSEISQTEEKNTAWSLVYMESEKQKNKFIEITEKWLPWVGTKQRHLSKNVQTFSHKTNKI